MGSKNRKSFSDLIFDNLSNKKEIFLFEDVFFSPLYMKDLINFSNFLLFKNLRGVFNLSSNERISKLDFGKKIARTFNFDLNLIIPTSIEERKDLVLRPKDMSLSNKKFKKYYNEPIDTIEESINKLKKKDLNKHYTMIPYGRQNINEEDIEAVIEVLKSDFITQGPVVPEFEKLLQNTPLQIMELL